MAHHKKGVILKLVRILHQEFYVSQIPVQG